MGIAGYALPAFLVAGSPRGLGSNVSIWHMPPPSQRKMQASALPLGTEAAVAAKAGAADSGRGAAEHGFRKVATIHDFKFEI